MFWRRRWTIMFDCNDMIARSLD